MRLKTLGTVRTNNFTDKDILSKINNLWQSTVNSALQQTTLYGVYYQYKSDYRGDYTLAIAIDDDNAEDIIIPDDTHYRVFSVDVGEDNGVYKTWQKIWQLEQQGKLIRSYNVDYEKYTPDGQIDIYISIKV